MTVENLYLIKGNATVNKYTEGVEILKVVKDSPKSYTTEGSKLRVHKSDVNRVLDTSFSGKFEMIVEKEEDIANARQMVYEKILEFNTHHYEQYKQKQENLLNYKLEEPYRVLTKGDYV